MAAGTDNLPQDLAREIGVGDLYEFLGISSTSTEKEITSGYRKKALKYHPDKNPDDPRAADLFQKLSKAYNILTDPAAKGAYDKWLKAKQAAKVRHEELNVKRRKLKETLESKESHFATHGWVDEREAASEMQKEIERLREEGFHKIKEQEEALRRQFAAPPPDSPDNALLPTLKVTWKTKASDQSNGGYNKDVLEDIFSKYGPVHHVLVSSKKNGKALVSFHQATESLCALKSGIGSLSNPLKIYWISGDPTAHSGNSANVPCASDRVVSEVPSEPLSRVGEFSGSYSERGTDYESLTLMRLRQAEERKRMCQQLQNQDEPV